MMIVVQRLLSFATGIALFAGGLSLPAQAAENFYAGKQITLIVGSETGGGYTAYARLLQRYMPKHIPGNPGIVVQNMPGAGGLQAINHLANIAAKDGTVIATSTATCRSTPSSRRPTIRSASIRSS